ncbi:MAG: hypothetical protein LQ337_002475 [Flavoplaca oasis]|nr:MAG: hypothetical protein LQ337_002475 [Flavoplaca oasis]
MTVAKPSICINDEDIISSHDFDFKHQLEAACQSGDLKMTHRLHSTWLNKQHPDPTTGLIHIEGWDLAASQAVQHNYPACLAYLFQHGYRVDEWNNLAILATHTASASGDTRCLQVLLDHGWDINSPEPHNEPPVMRRIVQDEALVRWFLGQGANPNAPAASLDKTPLSSAVQQASLDNIKLMFRHGGSTSRGQLLNMASDRTDSECVPSLQFLFDSGDTRINNVWLEDQPDSSPWNRFDNATPLHHAVRVGNIDSVRWLLDHGADPLKRSRRIIGSGTTPIDTASYLGYEEIAALLIQATGDSRQNPQKPPDIDQVAPSNGISAGRGNCAIQDYSMHLMLVNQRRTARKKQVLLSHSDLDSTPTQKDDQELQRLMQQAQNKKRALMNHPSLHDPHTETNGDDEHYIS